MGMFILYVGHFPACHSMTQTNRPIVCLHLSAKVSFRQSGDDKGRLESLPHMIRLLSPFDLRFVSQWKSMVSILCVPYHHAAIALMVFRQ